jgi:antitoxin component YwqK of YwqJK toxin-antitoxin module
MRLQSYSSESTHRPAPGVAAAALCLASIAFALAPTLASAAPLCELNGESVDPTNGFTTQGKTGVMRCRVTESGPVVREQELRNGKPFGLVRYYKNGALEREWSVDDNDEKDGRYREFAATPGEQNPVLREETYQNGRRVGRGRTFYPSGQLRSVVVYGDAERELASAEFTEHGQLHELHCADRPLLGPDFEDATACGFAAQSGEPDPVELYRNNGRLVARKLFVQGKLTRYESYFDSGKLAWQQDVTPEGSTERQFWESGIKRMEVHWAGNTRQRSKLLEQLFQERSGGLQQEKRWHNGRLVLEINWYPNGQMRIQREAVTWNDQDATHETRYYDNGNKSSEGTLVDRVDTYGQQKVGVFRNWDEQGRLRSEREHDDTGRPVRERTWNDTGEVIKDDRLLEDGSRQPYRR